MTEGNNMPRTRRAFTVIELLVVVGMTIVFVALLLPATAKVRAEARRISCKNNLKLIGLAMHNYHEVHDTFPPGWVSTDLAPSSGPYLGWGSFLLPYLDQPDLFNAIDFSEPTPEQFRMLGNLSNSDPLEVFLCPSDVTPVFNPLRSGFATSNYSAVFGSQPLPRLLPGRMSFFWAGTPPTPSTSDGSFWANSSVTIIEMEDGATYTAIVGERCNISGSGLWTGVVRNQFENDQVTDCSVRSRINKTYSGLSSAHAGGVNILMGDASVRFIDETIESGTVESPDGTFQRLCSRNDGGSLDSYGY